MILNAKNAAALAGAAAEENRRKIETAANDCVNLAADCIATAATAGKWECTVVFSRGIPAAVIDATAEMLRAAGYRVRQQCGAAFLVVDWRQPIKKAS